MPTPKKKPPQMTLGERSVAFDADPYTSAAAARFQAAVKAALVRKYGSLEDAAAAADRAFGPEGRYVSGESMRAAFSPLNERNHWRGEWVMLVREDAEVRAFFEAPRVDPAEELAALREYMAQRAPDALGNYDRKAGRIA
jgi:hypothetical protein